MGQAPSAYRSSQCLSMREARSERKQHIFGYGLSYETRKQQPNRNAYHRHNTMSLALIIVLKRQEIYPFKAFLQCKSSRQLNTITQTWRLRLI